MGKHKEENAIVSMKVEYYHSLEPHHKDNMELKRIDAIGWEEEYKKDPRWSTQKELTNYQEYKKLKKLEFEIRNKQVNK